MAKDTILGNMKVMLGADTAGFSKDMKSGQKAVSGFKSEISNMAKSLLAVAAPAAVFGAISKFAKDGVNEFVAYNKTVRETSEATGMTAEAVSRLIQVGDDWGIQSENITSAMTMMTKNGMQPSIENLAKLADEFVNTADKTAFAEKAAKLLGRNWSSLIPILKDGGKALRDQTAAVSDGLLATEESIRKARAYEVAMDNLGDMTTELKYLFADQLLPSIIAVTNATASLGFATLGLSSAANQGKITWREYLGQSAKVAWTSYSAADAQKWLADKLADTRDAQEEYNKSNLDARDRIAELVPVLGDEAKAMEELRSATDLAKEAQDNLKTSLSDLQGFVAGPLASETENYKGKIDGLNEKLGDTAGKIEELNKKKHLTDEQKTQLGELQTEYGEIISDIDATAVAHDEATKKILFNILTQRASMDGLSGSELEILTGIATSWGLVDQATANYTLNADARLSALATGAGIQETKNALMDIDAMTRNIPTDVQINIHTTYTESGAPLPTNPKNTTSPRRRAGGGPVGAGDWTVGEEGMEGLHLNPGSSGYVVSNQHFGNVSMNFSSPVTNGDQLYREFKRRLMEDMRTERLRD